MKFKELSTEQQELILSPHKNVINELKNFIGDDALKYKNRKESANAVANYFRKLNPKSEEEYNNFYKTCDDYLYENVYCNAENSCIQRTKKIYDILQENNCKNILEVGIGIGTYAIALSKAGFNIEVTKGSDKAYEFFKNRLGGAEIKEHEKIEGKFDCIMFFDVLEHINDPYKFLNEVSKHTDIIMFTHGFGVHREDMGGYPQHFDFKINSIKKHLEGLGFKKIVPKMIFPPHVYKRI